MSKTIFYLKHEVIVQRPEDCRKINVIREEIISKIVQRSKNLIANPSPFGYNAKKSFLFVLTQAIM